MMRMLLQKIPFAFYVLVLFWLVGFFLFVDHLSHLREPPITKNLAYTDAIVVPTGGSERVTIGIELLESGRGQKLFISGVHKGLTIDTLLGSQPVSADLKSCCIVLGYKAGSTIGNADETKQWIQQQGYHSIRLVTANYHMPRSLLLFRAVMPDIVIIPHPIEPDSVRMAQWWQHPGTIELLVTEYSKFLLAHLKITMEL